MEEEAEVDEASEKDENLKTKKKKTENEKENESHKVSNGKNDVEDELVDEAEYYAWNELRLHPLLMKSVYRLGIKEPIPIQKACIPAAAHQGKVG
ncbi:DEAD-box ATP-dependent RNA helicase 13-like [Quercus robur]|uniref:DEAD-box ATP-dependent RNA helicase 13-like n=1 Tax=Quercus robur TaxID=38942 RepID=UPI002163D856|nr:DEAD-box ATP-dependent RNA helicase 13-like [Quercus robur]